MKEPRRADRAMAVAEIEQFLTLGFVMEDAQSLAGRVGDGFQIARAGERGQR